MDTSRSSCIIQLFGIGGSGFPWNRERLYTIHRTRVHCIFVVKFHGGNKSIFYVHCCLTVVMKLFVYIRSFLPDCCEFSM